MTKWWLALVLVALVGVVAACGPDETLELFPEGGGATGGGAGGGCALHDECGGPEPWCDRSAAACVGCPVGLEQCGAACVDLSRDARHCGGCFAPCGVGEVCHQGACACAPGLSRCGDACVDLAADPVHCTACDHPCDAGQVCVDGGCHATACGPGLTLCDDGAGHQACVDLSDGPRCGSCDVVCGPHEVCVQGACREHHPATPCTACPCDDVCHAVFGGDAACCEAVLGEPGPTCVAAGSCP